MEDSYKKSREDYIEKINKMSNEDVLHEFAWAHFSVEDTYGEYMVQEDDDEWKTEFLSKYIIEKMNKNGG